MLEIKALGTLSIHKNGEIIKSFGSSKTEALLIYLALEDRQQSRNVLAALFWPESSEEKAQASLRVVLSGLRKNVGEYIEITREIVKLKHGPEVYLDVNDFEEKIAKGDLTQALDLYEGDLLAGLYIQGSNEFDSWRRWEQERLRALLIDAFQDSISIGMLRGDFRKVEDLSAKLLKHDPYNESTFLQYMTALALDGKRTDALRYYQQFCDVLMDELELEPSSELKNLKKLVSQGNLDALSELVHPKNNLPNPQTSFIGRGKECIQISSLLKDENCRLLTLTGMGGTGKTRLALNVAGNVLGLFSDGCFFVPTEELASTDFLIMAIAEVLNFDFDKITLQLDYKSQLYNYLIDRSTLLILDGYEHLVEGNDLLSEMLQRIPGLKFLITSRQILNIQGEWVHQVSGLPVPINYENVIHEEENSVDLFLERARLVNPTCEFSDKDMASVLRICQLVEGLPLGIELSAAWTAVLSCGEIADEIEKNFGFLTSPSSRVSGKHHSMKAIFNNSWQMLNKEQQRVLAGLSVFSGGFTRQAAKQVAGASLLDLTELLGRSMLQKGDFSRIDMHKVIHNFTEEIMKGSSKIWKNVQDNHSRYYIEFLQEKESDLNSENMVVAREELRREVENLRTAVNWAVSNWELWASTEAVRSYFSFYLVHGWHEGGIAFQQLASVIQENENASTMLEDPVYLSCRVHQAWFYSNLGMVEESENISNDCLQPLQKKDMNRELAICLNNLGINAEFRGEFDLSMKLLQQAIELGREKRFVAFPSFYLWLGYVYFLLGKYKEGMESFKTSYALFNETGNNWGASFALSKMGLAADGLGEHLSAMKYFHDAYLCFLETGDVTGQGYSLSRKCIGAYFLEEYNEAVNFGEKALQLFHEIGHRWGMCVSLCHLGFVDLGMRKVHEANEKFINALKQAQDSQMVPLSLYSLAGIASALMLEKEERDGLELFKYIQSHPKTPALYIDVARRWFQDYEKQFSNKKSNEKEMTSLSEIIEGVLVRFGSSN